MSLLRQKLREWTTWAGVALLALGFGATAIFDSRELAEYEQRWATVLPLLLHIAGVVGIVARDPGRRDYRDGPGEPMP